MAFRAVLLVFRWRRFGATYHHDRLRPSHHLPPELASQPEPGKVPV